MKTMTIGVLLAIIASISITTTRAQRPKYTGDANNDGFLDRVKKSTSGCIKIFYSSLFSDRGTEVTFDCFQF